MRRVPGGCCWSIAVVVAVLVVSGCGGGGAGVESAGESKADLASLVIIDRDTSVRPVGVGVYRVGSEGEGLAVGDSVQTSSSGFAEVAYFDGSLTRVDSSGEFTLVALEDVAGARRVVGSMVGGRSWNRVTKAIGPEDVFEVDTPVASASVRGTAFSVDCTVVNVCRFTVVEGVVVVTPVGGVPVSVAAPAELTVTAGQVPGAPVPVDPSTFVADGWISKNVGLDQAAGKATTTTTTTSSTTTTTTTPATTSAAPPASSVPTGPALVTALPAPEDLCGRFDLGALGSALGIGGRVTLGYAKPETNDSVFCLFDHPEANTLSIQAWAALPGPSLYESGVGGLRNGSEIIGVGVRAVFGAYDAVYNVYTDTYVEFSNGVVARVTAPRSLQPTQGKLTQVLQDVVAPVIESLGADAGAAAGGDGATATTRPPVFGTAGN